MFHNSTIALLIIIFFSTCKEKDYDYSNNNLGGNQIKKYSETIASTKWLIDECEKSNFLLDSINNTTHFKSKIILSACMETMADSRLNLRENDSFDLISTGVFCSLWVSTGKYVLVKDTIWLHGKTKFKKFFNDGEKLIIIDDSADYSNGPYYYLGDCKGLN